MSLFNKERLPMSVFNMTEEVIDKLRRGWYADQYFNNTVKVLTTLAKEGYKFGDKENDLEGIVDVTELQNGDIEVEMQFFTRRKPYSIVAGVDEALAILKVGTGYYDEDDQFVNTYNQLEVEAVHDGEIVTYDGNPMNIKPVLKVKGKYRYFGHLETSMLGVLASQTRVATNVYKVLVASKGKPVLFFPARFNHYKMQGIEGYAYWIAVQRYNSDYNLGAEASISTNEQGDWWGGQAGGTISHASICSFLGNTAETMVQFSRIMPVETPRIALIDFHNDCVGETLKVIDQMWNRYWECMKSGNIEEAQKYRITGVRPDTGGNMRDKCLEPLFIKDADNGVNPRLVYRLREAIDQYWSTLVKDYNFTDRCIADKLAEEFCKEIQIVVTGGFDAEKITLFEDMGVPVDVYGVGSSLLENASCNGTNNDYTADIVQVKVDSKYYPLAKVGRGVCYNKSLEEVK